MGEVKRVGPVTGKDDLFDRLVFYRCLKAYQFARPMTQGKRILEVGCGTCYGLDHLNLAFEHYVGLDIDAPLLAGLTSRYHDRKPSITFLCADVLQPPLKPGMFDVLIAFQVIEHVPQPEKFLSEARRMLTSGGILLITTPNRAVRLLPLQKPWNPEHVREYSYRAFVRLLRSAFEDCAVYSICGDELSYDLERLRVRQDPFDVYFRRPVRAAARHVLPGGMREFLKNRLSPGTVPALTTHAVTPPADIEISLDNYAITAGFAPRCLDFLAVATS